MIEKQIHWVLIRGLGRECEHWNDFIPLLQSAFPFASIQCLELPGAGILRHHKCPISIDRIVKSMRPDLKPPNSKVPTLFLTMSLGSMVAMSWASLYPNDLKGMVLINSSMGGISPAYRRLSPCGITMLLRCGKERSVATKEALILDTICNHPMDRQATLEHWIRIQEARPVSAMNGLRQLEAARSFRLHSPPTVPALILRGNRDRLVHPSCSSALETFLRAPMKTHLTGGHDLSVDDPQWVVAQVAEWESELTL